MCRNKDKPYKGCGSVEHTTHQQSVKMKGLQSDSEDEGGDFEVAYQRMLFNNVPTKEAPIKLRYVIASNSGASKTVTLYQEFIDTVTPNARPTRVTMANGSKEMANVQGNTGTYIKNGLLIPNLEVDLISVLSLAKDAGLSTVYIGDKRYIVDDGVKINGKIISTGDLVDGQYLHKKSDIAPNWEEGKLCNMSGIRTKSRSSWLEENKPQSDARSPHAKRDDQRGVPQPKDTPPTAPLVASNRKERTDGMPQPTDTSTTDPP